MAAETSKKIPWRPLIATVAVFISITVVLTLIIQAVGAERIRELIASAGVLAPLLYIAIRVVTFVIAPLNGGPLQFAAGIMFGVIPGTIYSLIAEIIGGSANFLIARKFGRPVVVRLAGEEGMARIDNFYHQIGDVWTLVYARFFLFAFYDFVSYAAGFTPLRFRQYVLITAIAGIIPNALGVFIGDQLTSGSTGLIILYVGLAILSVIPMIFYRQIRRLLKLDRFDAVSAHPE